MPERRQEPGKQAVLFQRLAPSVPARAGGARLLPRREGQSARAVLQGRAPLPGPTVPQGGRCYGGFGRLPAFTGLLGAPGSAWSRKGDEDGLPNRKTGDAPQVVDPLNLRDERFGRRIGKAVFAHQYLEDEISRLNGIAGNSTLCFGRCGAALCFGRSGRSGGLAFGGALGRGNGLQVLHVEFERGGGG